MEASPKSEKIRYRLLVGFSYLGNPYNGWQKQPLMTSCVTVQDRVEFALASLGFDDFFVFSGSRTDAKINAISHPAVVEITLPVHADLAVIERSRFKQAMNRVLADDLVSVMEVHYVARSFVFQRQVVQK